MPFPYKRVLLVGATAGIGAAMADRLIEEGSHVIAVGRRQDRLDAFVAKHGEAKATGIRFDICDSKGLEDFVARVTKEYADLDCVFLNAGIQSHTNLAKPVEFDFDAFHKEIDTNFTSLVNMTMKFLPFLMTKPSSLVFTGTHLAIVPAETLPAYSASKAALNSFVLCLREQLWDSTAKVIEISPPPVQTELHDYMGEEKGRQLGMPVNDFVKQTFEQGFGAGVDQIMVGSIGPAATFNEIVDKRRTAAENLAKIMRAH